MTLNLNKHGAEMQAAWKKVCDGNDPTDWALYGYEGNTFDLKLISTGEDGIEEMVDDLNANKILYAFIKVMDPKTSLAKFVFLQWQGESALATKKGKAATHVRDIQKYFHGHHITINARSEDEVCIEDILQKVSKASASQFNFNEKPTTMESAPAPVGTTHQRIVPQKELPNMDEREKFWNTEESKEKERKDDEKTRKNSEFKKIDLDRRAREEDETKAREVLVKEREKKISQIRDSELKSSSNADEKREWEIQQEVDHKEEMERQNRGKELQRKRSEEAKHLISQRSGNEARSVFEKNSSVGQMNFRKQSYTNAPPVPSTLKPTPELPPTNNPSSTQHHTTVTKKETTPESAFDAKKRLPEKKRDTPKTPQEQPSSSSNSISISHSNNGTKNANEENETQSHKIESKIYSSEEKLPKKKSKEVEEQANMVNANEVNTEDIVVPPPDSFGNDDNHRALAAAALQNNDQNQTLPNNYQQQKKQGEASVAVNSSVFIPPDVTHQTNDIKPDLIQDVTHEQPDLTKNGHRQQRQEVDLPQYMGEPEKNQEAALNGNGNVEGADDALIEGQHKDYGQCALALYDYQAADDTEISFDPGQVITHIDQIDPGWWQGLGPDGNFGLFPANYVEVIDPKELARAEELTA